VVLRAQPVFGNRITRNYVLRPEMWPYPEVDYKSLRQLEIAKKNDGELRTFEEEDEADDANW
jgi:hypothetical protein